MLWYLRWVQFSNSDPLIETYRKNGYPVKELKQYKNTTIVGFPTIPIICDLGMGDKLVTATGATPEEQYKWISLGEKYWLRGVKEDGNTPLDKDTGNQISYCLAGEKNHLLSTNAGLIRIEDDGTDNTTNNRYGHPQYITHHYNNGIKDTKLVKLINGIEIIGTDEHKILTVDQNLKFQWKEIKNISKGDIVVRRIGDNIWSYRNSHLDSIDMIRIDNKRGNIKSFKIPKKTSIEFGLFLGMLMSDGSVCKNGISFVAKESYVIDVFSSLVNNIFDITGKVTIDKRTSDIFVYTANSRLLSRWLVEKVGIPKYHNDNFIPNCILKSKSEVIKNFIKGYTLDGYIIKQNGNIAVCSTTSKTLAKDLAAILFNFGFDVYLGYKKGCPYYFSETNKGIGLPQYQVVVPNYQKDLFINTIGFVETRKTSECKEAICNEMKPTKSNSVPCTAVREFYYSNKKLFDCKDIENIMSHNSDNITIEVLNRYFSEFSNFKHLLDKNLRFTQVKYVIDYGLMKTYDFTIDRSHEYVANSVIVHNTLKYDPKKILYNDFVKTLRKCQSKVKCCSIMPQEETASYEYLPEQPVTKAEYEGIMSKIRQIMQEDVDFTHIDCASGACPIDFKKNGVA
jgi:hypothetical protein